MNSQKIDLLLNIFRNHYGDKRIKVNEPLSLHTSFRIGGPAGLYFQANTLEELIFAVSEAKKHDVPYFILGAGTNLLISDKKMQILFIKNNINTITLKRYGGTLINKQIKKGSVEVEVTSGVLMNQLVRFTLERDLSGMEAFLGQPGTVGGAVYMNAHNMKMGEYFGDKISEAKILTQDGKIINVERTYFRFGYDNSILQKRKDIVISVTIKLLRDDHEKIWERANLVMEYRKKTQPYGIASAGCIFKNISKADAIKIGTPDSTTSAGYLIEAVGLKNQQIGGAKFSEKHANFIVNSREATSLDVESLIRLAKKKVKDRYGIDLAEELIHVGGII